MPLGLECPLSRVASRERRGIVLRPLLSFPTRGLDVSPAIAQSVECLADNQEVGGSSPLRGNIFFIDVSVCTIKGDFKV